MQHTATYFTPTPIPVPEGWPKQEMFRHLSVQIEIEMNLVRLVKKAHELGFEVTITQHAAQPLRMGNKVTRIEVTPHHKP